MAELWLEGYADPWAFLKAVRGMGATSTRPTFLPRRLLAAVVDHYEKCFRRNGTIQVTYEVIRARGRKPLDDRRVIIGLRVNYYQERSFYSHSPGPNFLPHWGRGNQGADDFMLLVITISACREASLTGWGEG